MNIEEALIRIKDGGVARRTNWDESAGVKYYGDKCERVKLTKRGWVREDFWVSRKITFSLRDLTSEDWEIHENG